MSKAQTQAQLAIELRHLTVLKQQRAKWFGEFDRAGQNLAAMIERRALRLAMIGTAS